MADTGEARPPTERVRWGDDNPCPDCRTGLCHRCGEEKSDALLAPHMGVVLCGDCFYAKFTLPPLGSDERPYDRGREES